MPDPTTAAPDDFADIMDAARAGDFGRAVDVAAAAVARDPAGPLANVGRVLAAGGRRPAAGPST